MQSLLAWAAANAPWLVLALALALLWLQKLTAPAVIRVEPNKRYIGWRLIYSDRSGTGKPDVESGKLLRDLPRDITGKPDMVYRRIIGRGLMPVELKSGRIGEASAPHDGDLLQLAAYFLLVEAAYGVRPRFGRIEYADAAFRIRNSRRLRKQLADTLARMRRMLAFGEDAEAANASFAACRFCMCKQTVCPFSYFGLPDADLQENNE